MRCCSASRMMLRAGVMPTPPTRKRRASPPWARPSLPVGPVISTSSPAPSAASASLKASRTAASRARRTGRPGAFACENDLRLLALARLEA